MRQFMLKLSSAVFLLSFFSGSAYAAVTVSTPANSSTVTSPFTLTANASSCSSQPISAMAYSLDNGSDLATVYATYIQQQVSASTGAHTVHVKSWGNKGAVCVTDVAVTVSSSSGSTGTGVPSGATTVSSLQTMTNWKGVHDTGTPGSSSGSMSVASSPSRSGSARKFVTSFSNSGGERYSLTFGDDTTSTNFLYDTWIYIAGSASALANIEMDLNQVIENGDTVIFGFQCDGYAGTWDYTANTGSPAKPSVHWQSTGVACNPRNWGANAWHHVQISYSRTTAGVVTYQSVTFDGTVHPINKTVLSAFQLGWGDVVQTNFQVDGLGSGGTNTIYLDETTVSRW